MKKVIFILTLALCNMALKAQDYRFSQFYNAPVTLNPALTGDHNLDYRLILNYRNQWSDVADGFKTVSASYDMPAFEDVEGINKMGFGLSYLADEAGTTEFGFTNVNLSFAYHTRTTRFSKLSGGLVLGYGQSKINLNNVKWESQHNGNNYDPSLPSGEVAFVDQVRYFDAGLGLTYVHIDPYNDRKFIFGLSATHVNFPNNSFIDQYQSRLKPRLSLHGEADFGLETVTLKPKLLVMSQGPSTSFTIGSLVGFNLGKQPDSRFTDAYVGSSFDLGLFYRYNESVYFAAQYQFKKNLLIGVSYDFIITDLAAATSAGGYEIALRYQGMFKNERIKVKKNMENENKGRDKRGRSKGTRNRQM